MIGINDLTLIDLAMEKQKIDLQRGAMMRIARQASGKPGFECILCQKLGALLLRLGQMLSEVADIKAANLPDDELVWPEVLEHQRPSSYFA